MHVNGVFNTKEKLIFKTLIQKAVEIYVWLVEKGSITNLRFPCALRRPASISDRGHRGVE